MTKPCRLHQSTGSDSFTCDEGLSQSSEYIIRNVTESEGSDVPEDQSPPIVNNVGFMIDQGARILFPLMYVAFTVSYCLLI